ncbi:MAG: tetratricopeptide repeat protein [Chthoniobacteraceae bacterium]
MPVKTEKDLSPNARSLWLKAITSIELRNHPYAISLIQAVLKETPEFLDGRKQLRKAEIASSKGKKGFLSGLSTLSLKSTSSMKKDPLAAIELAEKSMENDPYNPQANHLLKEAALTAGFPETAAFALETIAEGNPKDTKILHELGEHYYKVEEFDKAVDVFRRIVDINPADLAAIKREKDAAARTTMKKGGWETAESYRDVLKDEGAAVSLEQQNRVVMSDEMIDQQLVQFHERAEKEPQSVDVARKIAALYEQKNDLETALQWYAWANELAKNVDPLLARKVSDLQMKILDGHITSREEFIAAAPDHPDSAMYRTELETLKKQKAESLISEARKRVERNPTDLMFRYELGEQLLNAGQASDAIPELQKARNNPNVRLRAMYLLGQCYFQKGMLDLAVKQFSDAAKEMLNLDALKKEALYSLGLVYEKMGKAKESLDCMKEIYDVDYGYKDVAQRVEGSYGDSQAK